jgi:hypothetical protein
MQARWYIAREGHEIIKGRGAHRPGKVASEGRGAHRPGKVASEIPADIPMREPSLLQLLIREARGLLR